MNDVWTTAIEVWPRRRWLPFTTTVWNHAGPGRGWFHGSCWRVIPILNGNRSPFLPEGVGWARTETRALHHAHDEAAAIRNVVPVIQGPFNDLIAGP